MHKKISIVFFGNSKYSVIDAEALFKDFGLSAIVTIPNRPVNRKEMLVSPVKTFAKENNIPLIEALKLTPDTVEEIKKYEPDFLVVADYGLILPRALLALPKYAALNVHHSLLPKYRGPSPAPAAILSGDKESGVTIITMNEKVDAGNILAQVAYTLASDETTDSLLTKLNTLGAKAVTEVIEQHLTGKVEKKVQDETRAVYTKFMSKTEGKINLTDSPEINWRKIRAYGKWPGTYFLAEKNGKEMRVKIAKASHRNNTLLIERVIPENGKEMGYEDFLRGMR